MTCADPVSFVSGAPTLTVLFVFDELREDPNTNINGLLSAQLRKAILMAFRWRANDGPTLNAGLAALRFFRGSGPVLIVLSSFAIILKRKRELVALLLLSNGCLVTVYVL